MNKANNRRKNQHSYANIAYIIRTCHMFFYRAKFGRAVEISSKNYVKSGSLGNVENWRAQVFRHQLTFYKHSQIIHA